MKLNLPISILLFCAAVQLHGQNFIVLGGTLHQGNGNVVEHAAIFVEDGKILAIHDARTIRIDPGFGPIIHAHDKHIYPGMIAAYSTLGLNEIDYERDTRDYSEIGDFTPNVRTLIAYNAGSKAVGTVLSNGILYAQIVPEGGLISGSSSVVKLDAWNWEDAAAETDEGIHLWWPVRYSRGGWWANPGGLNANDQYTERVERIEKFLRRAKSYLAKEQAEANLVLDGMKGIFSGERNLYVHIHGATEIVSMISLMKELEIPNVVMVGGMEAGQVLPLIKTSGIPVMLTCIHKLPPKNQGDIDHWYELPALLHQAEIPFCLTYGEVPMVGYGAWENRSLPFLAGTAAAYGLDKETALASVTSFVSDIIRMDYSGTVEAGEEATFLISEGDLLDMRTSIVTHAWIKGEPVDLDDSQKALYRKFRDKYVEEGKLLPEPEER